MTRKRHRPRLAKRTNGSRLSATDTSKMPVYKKDSAIGKAAEKWNQHTETRFGKDLGISWWEAGTEIQRHINRKTSGRPDVGWIQYTLDTHHADLKPSQTRFVSLGCGTGGLERAIAKLVRFKEFDAYDVSEKSVEKARELASAEGLRGINYLVSDVNQIRLQQSSYDAVWVNAAMHHFDNLEHICGEIALGMKPNGVLVMQEYIGPNRFQFPERQKDIANHCINLLPERYRTLVPEALERQSKLPAVGQRAFLRKVLNRARNGDLLGAVRHRLHMRRGIRSGQLPKKTCVDFPTEQGVILSDPSEAVRSEDILPVVRQFFEITEKRDWGGNLVQFLLADIAGNFVSGGEEGSALLQMLLNIEDTLISCGELRSDFAYIVARPLRTKPSRM